MQKEEKKKIIGIVPIYRASFSDIDRILNLPISIDELIIADDSGDNYSQYIAQKEPKRSVKYLYANELGLSKTINIALKKAIVDGADWVVILNQDSEVRDDFIDYYRNYVDGHNCDRLAILAPQHDYDRHKREQTEGYKSIRYADLSGCMFNTKVIKKIGGFNELFFIDGLDTEWCLRAIKNDFRIIRCNSAVIGHHPGETKELLFLGKCIMKYGCHSPERYYYQFLAGFYIHYRYHDWRSDLFLMVKFLKVVLLFDEKMKYMKEIRKAYMDNKRIIYARCRRGQGNN